MSRAYVFLIHGVGKQIAGSWSDSWRDALITALRQYAPYDKKSPEEIRNNVICFVPISYDAVFEGYRKRWVDLAGALADSEVLKAGPLKDALAWVKDDQDKGVRDAFWTYALDAVLWFGLPQARAAVLASVLDQVGAGVKQMIQENGRADQAHWVAHSLGTSVLNDALLSLRFAQDLHEGAFDPANLKWQSVSMVANTSRLLQASKSLSTDVSVDNFNPYSPLLQPGSPTSLARSYYNFHHRLDPICWLKQFNPPAFGSAYTPVETIQFKDPRRVHDLVHYIENPRVHQPLLRAILGDDELGNRDEVQSVWSTFLKSYPLTGSDPFAELRSFLSDDANEQTVKDIAVYLTHAFKALEGL